MNWAAFIGTMVGSLALSAVAFFVGFRMGAATAARVILGSIHREYLKRTSEEQKLIDDVIRSASDGKAPTQ